MIIKPRIEKATNLIRNIRRSSTVEGGATWVGGRRLSFGVFVLDCGSGTLLKNGMPVPIGKRGARLLEVLVERPGEVIPKIELLQGAWPGMVVEESNLSVQIAQLRKIIGTNPGGQDWITTIPRVGYRFHGDGSSQPAPDTRPLLAVLPLTVSMGDGEAELFAEGLADELTTALTKVIGLTVTARSSSFAYRGSAIDVREISRALGARYIVEGSVRRSGDQIRIAAHLVDGTSGSQLWAERYDRTFGDVFTTQDDLTRRIVTELIAVLNPSEVSLWPGIPTRGTGNIEAYRCFLRGRVLQRSPTRTAQIYARYTELFREAIAIDADYAAPYAGLAMGSAYAFYYRWADDPVSSLADAYAFVGEAIARDPGDAYIHSVAALVAMYGRDLERWTFEVDEALAIDRHFAPALALRAPLRICAGEPELAIDDLQRAIRLDPLFTHNYLHDLGVAHLMAGHYEHAIAAFRERIMLVPDADASRAYLASALGNLGRLDEAKEIWAEVLRINPAFEFNDRISSLPFRHQGVLVRIADGLERAGLPSPAFLKNA